MKEAKRAAAPTTIKLTDYPSRHIRDMWLWCT